jgi:branched-chain amino acid transport system substrate-binding protein
MNRRLLSSIAIVTSVVLVGACQSTSTPAPTPVTPTETPEPTATPVPKGQIFKIYSSLPLSGDDAAQAQGIANAIDLAIEKQTDGGTLCDGVLKITRESLDDTGDKGAWDTFREQDNAYKANADVDAMAYIGPFDSGAARVSIPILNQSSLAMISPAADGVGLTKPYAPSDPMAYYPMGKRSFMRLAPLQDAQGAAGAKWARTLGATKAFIVEDGEQYGRGASDAFDAAFKEAGAQVAGRARIDEKGSNIAAIVADVKSAGADLVYFSGTGAQNAGALLKALRAGSVKAKFMGTAVLLARAFAGAAGDAAQGAYTTAPGLPAELPAKGQQFARDYESRFGTRPDVYAFNGYEAASVVLAAAQQVCAKDRVALLDAMFGAKDFDGVLGKWSFDANGDVSGLPVGSRAYGKNGWETVAGVQ